MRYGTSGPSLILPKGISVTRRHEVFKRRIKP